MRLNQSVEVKSGRNGMIVQSLAKELMKGAVNLDSALQLPQIRNGSKSPRDVSSSPVRRSPENKNSGSHLSLRSSRNVNPEFHSNRSSMIRKNARGEASALSKSQQVPQGMFKVTIQDMINSSKKVNDNWGVDGYTYKTFNSYLDKPTVFSIPKESDKGPRDYISMLQKQKKLIPGPEKYDVGQNLGKNGKFFIPKGNSPSFFTQVQKKAKETPGVGQYKPTEFKYKVLGNYTQKLEGGGYIDEAIVHGKSTPSHYPAIKLDIIKNRTYATKIHKPNPKDKDGGKVQKNNSPSPHSYKFEDSYDKTQ